MKTYSVKFDCLIPCEITTVVEAENENEAYQKVIENEFENFMYKTKGKMYNIVDIRFEELKIQCTKIA